MNKEARTRISRALLSYENIFFIVLQLVDSFIIPLLWGTFAVIVLALCLFRLSSLLFFLLLVSLMLISVLGHTIREVASTFDEYPFWRSYDLKITDLKKITIPVIGSYLVSIGVFCYTQKSFLYVILFFYVLFIEIGTIVWARKLSCSAFLVCLDNKNFCYNNCSDSCIKMGNEYVDVERCNLKNSITVGDSENVDKGVNDSNKLIASQTRIRTTLGFINIDGSLLIELEKGCDFTPVYISFCPPFEKIPNFEFETSSEEDVNVKVSSLQPFGVRLEVRRKLLMNDDNVFSFLLEYFVSDSYEE